MKLYFIAAMLIFANSVASDTSVFSPSDKMKSFNKNDFGTSSDYFMKLIVGPAVMLGFGVVLTFIFLCWSVCRSCKCLQCCCDCQQPTSGKIKFYLILLIALTAGCIAMVIAGFAADAKLSKALNDVPALVGTLNSWVTTSKDKINAVNATCLQLKIDAATLTDTQCSNPGPKDSVTAFATNIQDGITSMNSLLSAMNFNSIQKDADSNVANVNEKLHLAMVIILAVALCCAGMTMIISLLQAFYRGEPGCISRCFVRSITTIMIITIFIVWILSAILLLISSAMADFCVNPVNNIINLSGITDTTSTYFLQCNYVVPPPAWPFQTATNSIETAVNSAITLVNTSKNCYAALSTCNPACVQMKTDLDTTTTHFIELKSRLISADGFFAQFQCKAVNGLFQAVLNTLCGSGFDAIASSYEVLIAFSVMLVCAEFIKRKMPAPEFKIGASNDATDV